MDSCFRACLAVPTRSSGRRNGEDCAGVARGAGA